MSDDRINILTIVPMKLKLSDYEIGKTLGTGSFGRVKIAKNKKNGKYYAIKLLKKSELIKLKQVDHIMNEIKILSILDHPFLITTQGFSQDERQLYLVIELVNGGELFTYLRSVHKFSPDHANFYTAQVIQMFEYLHSKDIVYRDLKPENVLIDKEGYLKLTDFGFAKVVQSRTYTLCGTPEYLAPEILLNKGHGKPVDWWTVGVLIYEMNAGIDPFNDEDPMVVYQKILKGKVKFPSSFNPNTKSLVKHLLEHDLSKRYGNLKNGINDIKGHRLFKNFDWEACLAKKIRAPYIPKVSSSSDTSNFQNYPDSDKQSPAIKSSEDPFLAW